MCRYRQPAFWGVHTCCFTEQGAQRRYQRTSLNMHMSTAALTRTCRRSSCQPSSLLATEDQLSSSSINKTLNTQQMTMSLLLAFSISHSISTPVKLYHVHSLLRLISSLRLSLTGCWVFVVNQDVLGIASTHHLNLRSWFFAT